MADGSIKIGIDLEVSKAVAQGKKAGQSIAKAVESGLKSTGKVAQNAGNSVSQAFQSAGSRIKSSMQDIGSSASSAFSNVGSAARTESGNASDAFHNISSNAAGAFADVSSQAASGFSGVADAANSSSSNAAESFKQVGDAADSAFGEVSDAAQESGDDVEGVFASRIPVAAAAAAAAIGTVVVKVGEFLKESVAVGMDFEAAMAQVAATMGVTVDEIGELTDFANEMGATTAFSASEAAQALNYMALAGYDAQTSMGMLPNVLNLAAAGSIDLADASDMVTDAQSALGLTLEETAVMVDQMAKTASKTNTSVAQLGSAFLTVGGTAQNLSGGTAELAQQLGILADNGIKGAEGGTALRNIILSLTAPTDVAKEAIESLGLAVFDAEGKMRPMPDIFADLNAAMEPLTQEERINVLSTIFNKVDLKSANALLNTSAERFGEVADAIDNAQGAAQKMAETQLDNLAGDVEALGGATESLQIKITDKLNPVMREAVQFATDGIIPAISSMVDNFDKLVPVLSGVAVGFASLKLYNKVIESTGGAASKSAVTVSLLGKQIQLTGAAAKVATVGTKAFGRAASAVKGALPVIAITALVEGLTLLVGAFTDASERAQKFDKATNGLKNSFGSIDESVESATDAINSIDVSPAKQSMQDLRSEIEKNIDAQADMADRFGETWADINADSQLANDYVGIIERLTSKYDENGIKAKLNATEQEQLRTAVANLNEVTGQSVEVIDAENGILSESTEQIKSNTQQWIENAKAKAASEQMVELQRQQLDNENALAQARDAHAKAQDALNKAKEQGYPITQGELDLAAEAERVYNDALGTYQANIEAQQELTEQVSGTDAALAQSAAAMKAYIEANDAWRGKIETAGITVDEFATKLADMGFSMSEMVTLNDEQLQHLVDSFNGSTADIVAICDQFGIEVPEKLRLAADEMTAQFTAGLSEGTINIVNAAAQTKGLTLAQFAELANSSGVQGEVAVRLFAEAIQNGMPVSEAAAMANAQAADGGLASGDPGAKGAEVGTSYGDGIDGKQDYAKGKAENVAAATESGFKSYNDKASSWGNSLAQNFASGIKLGQKAARTAASIVASAAASVLRHSVPKEGPLHEGGEGEARWGRHLVENIAAGMLKAKPEVKKAADEVGEEIHSAFDSPWLTKVDVGGKSLKGLYVGSQKEALSQVAETVRGGFSIMSAQTASNKSTTIYEGDEILNINQPVKSPAELMREVRLERTYGLAGARR